MQLNRAVTAFLLVSSGLLGACGGLGTASNQQLSSGYLGCRPSEVQVSEEEGHSIETWVASCRGRTFHCMRGGDALMSCTEDYRPASSGGERPAAITQPAALPAAAPAPEVAPEPTTPPQS